MAAPAPESEGKTRMPSWVLPRPIASPLTFFEQFYPLRVYNSMTRTLTPFVPMNGKQVRCRLWPLPSPVPCRRRLLPHAVIVLCVCVRRAAARTCASESMGPTWPCVNPLTHPCAHTPAHPSPPLPSGAVVHVWPHRVRLCPLGPRAHLPVL